MKNTFLLLVMAILVLSSCSQEAEDLSFGADESKIATTRNTDNDDDCVPVFQEGHVNDLFGDYFIATHFQGNWQGPFEQNAFPCPSIEQQCCSKIVELTYPFYDYPLPTICNWTMDAAEQQVLYNFIMDKAGELSITCEESPGFLKPVGVDVYWSSANTCEDYNDDPCPWPVDHPCDCMEDFPNDPYWEDCQNYQLFIAVKFAQEGPCPGFGPGPVDM